MNYDIAALFSPRLYSQESHINIKREDKAETKANSNQNLHDSSFTNALVVIIYNTFLEMIKYWTITCLTDSSTARSTYRGVYLQYNVIADVTNVSLRRVAIIFASINSSVIYC